MLIINYELLIVDCQLSIVDCCLLIINCWLLIVNCQLLISLPPYLVGFIILCQKLLWQIVHSTLHFPRSKIVKSRRRLVPLLLAKHVCKTTKHHHCNFKRGEQWIEEEVEWVKEKGDLLDVSAHHSGWYLLLVDIKKW